MQTCRPGYLWPECHRYWWHGCERGNEVGPVIERYYRVPRSRDHFVILSRNRLGGLPRWKMSDPLSTNPCSENANTAG